MPPERNRRTASPTSHLTTLYVSALTALALFAGLNFGLVELTLSRQTADSRVVNIAGRQRVLSQQMSRAALGLQIARDGASRRQEAAELQRALGLWERSHAGLQSRDPELGLRGSNSPEVMRLFGEIEPDFQEMQRAAQGLLTMAISASAESAPQTLAATVDDLLAAQQAFAFGMDRIASQYEREALLHQSRLERLELALLFLNLSVLMFLGALVFRPAVRRLRRTYGDLQDTNEQLEDEIVERQRAEDLLRTRVRQQAAVAELGNRALGGEELSALLERAVTLAAESLSVEYAEVLELLPEEKAFLLRAGIGWRAGLAGQATVDTAMDTQAGYTLLRNEPVILEDLRSETRFRGHQLLHDHGVVSGMTVVIPGRDRAFGVLGIHTCERREFTQDDMFFLQSVAHVLAGAVEWRRAEAELAQARDSALESARLKSSFLANMSHEIRTPMNSIVGMADLLAQTRLTGEQREFVETVKSAADTLLTIINDILDFSKIEAGKLTFAREDFDLRTAVDETVDLVAHRAQAKGLEMVTLIYRDVPTLLQGDPGRLRQVLLNLLSNAIKFTERGEVVVRVMTEQQDDSQAVVRFSVSDTGTGIAESVRRRLFQPFIQADGSQALRHGGTGLGLAIARQLVELMGGDIGAESTPGRGTTFWFTARFEKQPAPAAVAEESAAAPTGPLAGLRALVVDDNETSRRILRHQVRQWGMLEGSAADAGEALELLRHAADGGKPFHVALLDMNMPGPDGLALAREIKADPRIARTVLVVMTSLGHRLDAVTLEAAGIAAQFAKPVKQSQLFTSVLHLLSGERERAAAPRAATEERTLVSPGASSPSGAREGEDAMPRVVLAEDNEDNRRLAEIMLRRLGCHVEAVTTGQAVLEALGRAAWDLVFMDCQMPEMDGYEATRAIREHERESGAHIPIIALTASALKGSREKCLDAGMDDHVTKPFKIKSLEEILRRWLPQKLAARVTAVPAPPADADGHAEEGRSEATSVRLRLRELHAEMSSGELFERQIERFVSGAPARLDQMRAARSRGDAKSVAEAAHSFKGLVGFFGAPHLVALAEDIQERCGAGGLGDMGNLFAEFEVGLGDLLRLLREERDQHTVKEST